MSWGQPQEVPQQDSSWGNNPQQSTWGNTESTWANNGDQQQQDNKPAWGDSNNGLENKEFRGRGRGGRGGRGDRGGRGRGGDRGGRGGRGRGRGNNDNKEEGEIKPQNDGGGWGQQTQEGWGQNQQEKKEPAQQWGGEGNAWGSGGGEAPKENAEGWGQQNTETQGWGGNQDTNNQDGQQEQKGKGRGKKRDSPPPAKRVRPNPIVITVEDDEESETQNIIINECPVLQNKQKGLIKSEEQQVCFEGNIKIDENLINTQFISFDTELKVKIDSIEDYTIENAKDLLKNIGDQIVVGIVQGVDKDNQKAVNKLADNLLDKQQSIHFKDVSLFSIKQLYKGQSTSRLAFVKQIQD